jgi:hypothetical protein
MRVPAWAQKRADLLSQRPEDRQVLVAYPQSRSLFALPIIFLVIAGVPSVGSLVMLLIAARGSGAGGSGVTALLIIGLIGMTALYAFVAFLLVASFRTSVLATPLGVEIRQLGTRDTFHPWQDIVRVEEQPSGYWAGSSVLALTSGARIRIKATDSRRAKLYNGHRFRDVHDRWLNAPMPWTQRLIDAHRAHLAGHV